MYGGMVRSWFLKIAKVHQSLVTSTWEDCESISKLQEFRLDGVEPKYPRDATYTCLTR